MRVVAKTMRIVTCLSDARNLSRKHFWFNSPATLAVSFNPVSLMILSCAYVKDGVATSIRDGAISIGCAN